MPDLIAQATPQAVISVAELNRLARGAIERGVPLVWVAGEISNFKRYDSGHCYFTLKDGTAQVDAVMFRHKAQYLDWAPENGMQVEVRATATLYEARGKFQLAVDAMRRAGLGALYAAFEKLKSKLEAEGLFDPAVKRALPPFPRTVGVVTSPQAAALRDVISALRRRMPGIAVIIYPAPVQGEGAGAKIAEAIALAGERAECDVLIVCRGGGSIEDLWAYNEEAVARAIRACPLPVVSGVGHETDFTIADFAADLRAPTPTAAAELVSPDGAKLRRDTALLGQQLSRVIARVLEDRMQRLDYLSRRLTHPGERIRNQELHLEHLASRLRGGWRRGAEERSWALRDAARRLRAAAPDLSLLVQQQQELARRLRSTARERMAIAAERLAGLRAHLLHLNPQRVLERGYSITETADGRVVRDGAQLAPEQELKLTLARGWARVKVKDRA
ncbi:MAG: exodeoxyribonuclease VII large subunit [Burkholderiales bacterium]|jgi:exodeoxyribonuclease VII large subunit|nr:exodeoxyribonuclease VII large subunit [Burkholderiales bacterium]